MNRVLFVCEKWAECDPTHGLSNAHHNFIGSFRASGMGAAATFFYDEVAWRTGARCDAALLDAARAARPDLVFFTPVRGTDLNPAPDTMARLRGETGARIAALYADSYDDAGIDWAERYVEAVDISIVQDCYSHYRRRARDPNRYLDAWTPQDPTVFFPGDGARTIDVSFVGSVNRYPERKRALGLLAEAGMAATHRGGQAEDRLDIEGYAAILRASRITLNFARPVYDGALDAGAFQCKGRVVEATLSGALLFEQANAETARWLTPGVHYVAYEDERDLVAKARHYLAHEDERAEIAATGAAHAQAHLSAAAYWRRLLAAVLPAETHA